MKTFEQQLLVEVVLYILNKTGGLDYYHLFKVLYFAEKMHLAVWGQRITRAEFCAMDAGPVPSDLYDAVKGKEPFRSRGLLNLYNEAIFKAGDDASYMLLAKRKPNMDYIPKAVAADLDASIASYAHMSFSELMKFSHDSAWQAAEKRGEGCKCIKYIDTLDMAKASGATEEMISYIEEKLDFERAFS